MDTYNLTLGSSGGGELTNFEMNVKTATEDLMATSDASGVRSVATSISTPANSGQLRISSSYMYLGSSSATRTAYIQISGSDVDMAVTTSGVTSKLKASQFAGFVLTEALNGLGLNYNDYTIDEASVGAWGTTDDHIPSEARIIANISTAIRHMKRNQQAF